MLYYLLLTFQVDTSGQEIIDETMNIEAGFKKLELPKPEGFSPLPESIDGPPITDWQMTIHKFFDEFDGEILR